MTMTSLVPSLVAAQSTSRFPEHPAEWGRWQAVDYEILALLQDHLAHIERGYGGDDTSDAWTEGEAACEILSGMTAVFKK
jgi:aspartyl/asparaginyl beta-hydroxylase (cupin superfamily)